MEKEELYCKVKNLLCDVTPLTADCGKLCGRNCCKGDGRTGMYLFPGETTALDIIEGDGIRLAVCNGRCEREGRPLSCMMFPFFPVINEKEKCEVSLDYRATGTCPLVENAGIIKFSRKFLKNMKKAGKLLSGDRDCLEFMKNITEEISEAKELSERLEERR